MELDDLIFEEHEEFNQYLDETENNVEIVGVPFRPSEVLFNMSKETYRIALTDYQDQQLEEFKQKVFSNYPTPIAYYFRQTHHGYLDHNNRLHLLRSTWEAMIFVLYAIVIGEARRKNFPLRTAGVRENDLYNFSVDRKLSIIEKVLTYDRDNGFGLKCGVYFDVAEIVKIKQLNYRRNGFQHSGALSEEQAAALFSELIPEVLDALKSMLPIENIEVFHFLNSDGNPLSLRCETFIGQSPNRTLKTYSITAAQMAFAGAELSNQCVLTKIDDDIFSVSPFLHFKSDDDGHLTNLCYLHQYNTDNPAEFKFEIARRAVYYMEPIATFNDRMLELQALST
jgi:hypothetical protein